MLSINNLGSGSLSVTIDSSPSATVAAIFYARTDGTFISVHRISDNRLVYGPVLPADLAVDSATPADAAQGVQLLNAFVGSSISAAPGTPAPSAQGIKANKPTSAVYDPVGHYLALTFDSLTKRPFRIAIEAGIVEIGVARIFNIDNVCHLDAGSDSGSFWVTQEKHNITPNASVNLVAKPLTYTTVSPGTTEIRISGLSSDISAMTDIYCIVAEYDIIP